MRVAVYGGKISKTNLPSFYSVFECIQSLGWSMMVEDGLASSIKQKGKLEYSYGIFNSHEDLVSDVDLMVSIGGDGTFLKSVSYIKNSGVPILGINTGRLGFLANVSKEKILEALNEIDANNYMFQKRSLLSIALEGSKEGPFLAMNELAIHKKDSSSMVTINVTLDGNFLNSYWSDGLIVSTPTGSTAYNLSCGGPIVTPGCQVHMITPIAPHNLNVRPMVVPDHMPITLSAAGRGRSYLVSIDGKSMNIRQGQKITIKKADFMINVIKFESNNFLDTIRNKMLWGSDKRN